MTDSFTLRAYQPTVADDSAIETDNEDDGPAAGYRLIAAGQGHGGARRVPRAVRLRRPSPSRAGGATRC
jgi:hypothetical protein